MAIGFSDGSGDGTSDGNSDGSGDGRSDGETDGLAVTGIPDGLAVGTTPPPTLVTVTVLPLRPVSAPGPVLRLVRTTEAKAALAGEAGPPKVAGLIPVRVWTRGRVSWSMTREVGSAVGVARG